LVNAPGALVGGVNRRYDDGAVLVDISGNVGNLTTYWGYERDSQYNNPAPGQLSFHSTSTSPEDGFGKKISDDPNYGFQVGYERVLASFEKGSFGIGINFSYMRLNIKESSLVNGTLAGVTDVYSPGLALVPPAPYYGPYASSSASDPLFPDMPVTRTPFNTPASASIYNSMKGDVFGITIGPFYEIKLAKNIAINLHGGFSIVNANYDVIWTESINPTLTTDFRNRRNMNASNDQWLLGATFGGQLNFNIYKGLGAFIGAEYQNVGQTAVSEGNKKAILNLGAGVFIVGGLSISF
jgi:hypothetical protein